ncbi:histone-lysine N-methyltransferase, H3 lysine-79 specific-like protein [Tasmannia lanceolata]|uniref:histone-lysine N-methyltransferase, H3 lysine-79 specific-like protein n=1 Tax=Tasmannia lanceolata TaxID=3420 RepID=UPI0040641818
MPYFRLIVGNSPFNYAPNTLPGSLLTSVVDRGPLQPTVMQASYQILFLKNISRSLAFNYPIPKVQLWGTFQHSVNVEASSETGLHCQTQLNMVSSLEPKSHKESSVDKNEEHLLHDFKGLLFDEVGSASIKHTNEDDKEIQRRRKIGLANKGKTPWNKGRTHSAETRERIKQRTLEALRDPKIRKKMSEWPRAHSVQSKAKIGIGLRRIWEERLKWRRLQEKCYLKWAESIADEAKRGGSDQVELDWDSYETMKEQIIHEQLQWAADKAKAKEMAKLKAKEMAELRAEQAAKERADKKAARLAQQRKEKEQKAKARAEMKKKVQRKSQEEKEELSVFTRLKLKARLTKNKNSAVGEIASQQGMANDIEPAIEKWDLEFIKREKKRMEVSLADQIRAAKNRKTEPAAKEVPKTSFFDSSSEGKSGGS